MKYYIIAGEASGDLHGSNLIYELQKLDKSADFRCWGGDKMKATGATLIKHYKDLAFMGFSEVLKNLPVIFRNLRFCKEDILKYKPDALVLIDYPGFNLRIAKWARRQKLKIIFYISPQVWAWKEGRVKLIKKCIDKMLVILPFEKEFYKKWNYNVEYVGHPLVEVIDNFKKQTIDNRQYATGSMQLTNVVALLPGSRKQELKVKLPVMLEVAKYFPDYKFIVAKAPGIEEDFYAPYMQPYTNVEAVSNKTYELLTQSKAALVTSGTATLETALFGVPEIVCYKGNALSFMIAKKLVKIKFISLVNLIMSKEVVKELIQNDLTVNNLKKELELILFDEEKLKQIKRNYDELKGLLSQGGNASANAAKSIYTSLNA